jgi:hypothetical protein
LINIDLTATSDWVTKYQIGSLNDRCECHTKTYVHETSCSNIMFDIGFRYPSCYFVSSGEYHHNISLYSPWLCPTISKGERKKTNTWPNLYSGHFCVGGWACVKPPNYNHKRTKKWDTHQEHWKHGTVS